MKTLHSWIDDAPASWDVRPLGFHFRERKETVSDSDFAPLSVTKSGVVPQLENAAKTDNNDNRKLVRRGDFAINSRSDRKGSAGISDRDGSVSVIYTVLEPRDTIDRRFAHYLLRSPAFQEEFYRWGNGIVADLWSTRFAAMKRIPLALPALPQQRAIADYLDRETAQIDTLIEEQRYLSILLSERRDALWSDLLASTRAPATPIRRVIESIVDGPFGSALTSAHYADSGTRVIRLGNIGIFEFKDDDAAYIDDEYGRRLDAHSARPGDVVIAGLGDDRMPLGRAALVPDHLGPAIVKADCYRVRPDRRLIEPAYLAWALSAPPSRTQIALLARGSTRARLNTSVVREVTIPLPPLAVQKATVSGFESQAASIDRSIVENERFVELATERRSALITAAVTGQIDVGAMA